MPASKGTRGQSVTKGYCPIGPTMERVVERQQ